MTGDQTSLEVSRRLAETGWKRNLMDMGEERRWFWVLRAYGEWACVYSDNCGVGDNYSQWYDARDLAELEAETGEMWLECTIVFGVTHPTKALARLDKGGIRQGECFAEHVIDAWGNAIAEAKEKP